MTQTSEASIERCCRLCAKEQDVTIMIFSEEAEAMLLQNKLNNYLLLEVEEDDKLPKHICIQCCTKLQTVCDFIDTARKAQKELLYRSIMLDQIIPSDCVMTLVKAEDVQHKLDEQSDSNDLVVENMEISVDPMMVLQNSEETLFHSCYDHGSEMAHAPYLHGLDTENVTIKLIKKGDNFDANDEKKIKQSDTFVNNVQNNFPIKPFLCLTCKRSFYTELELTNHSWVHTCETKTEEEEIKQSDTCDNDEKNNLDVKPFLCLTCKRSYFTELALKNHSWVHTCETKTDKQYKCNTCTETFDYKYNFISHLKQHQGNGLCQLCGRMFRSEKTYVAHMSVHLPSNKSYTCKICGRSYNTWGSLKTHSVTHSTERPYQCHFCKKTFKRNQDLKFHINQHTGAKPYKCPFCEKCFASSGNCYSHRSRMHPGKQPDGHVRRWNNPPREYIPPRPITTKSNIATSVNGIVKYKCHLCDHSFVKKENYTYHMYQHTGEKPFHCAFCPDKFMTRRGLIIHHDNKHPKKDRPVTAMPKNILLCIKK